MAEEKQILDAEQTANEEQNEQVKKKCSKNGKSQCDKQLKELEQKLIESEKKAEEYKQSWYRTAADFENFKKRNNEARSNAYADGKADAVKSILVIGDNLDRALATAFDEQTKAGLELIVRGFAEVLKNMGIEEVNPVGESFDPNLHEAVFQCEPEDGDESGKIKSVFKKGYSLNGKMLRYAQVVVIK